MPSRVSGRPRSGVGLRDLEPIARRQDGLVRRDQTEYSSSAWYRVLDRGDLIGIHPNVARLVGAPETERQRIRAATLAVDGAIASHRSAAVLWEFVDSIDSDVEVHVTADRSMRQRRALTGVVCHRPRDRRDVRSVVRRGIPATPPLRTLLDLGITHPRLVHDAVGRSLSMGVLSVGAIDAGIRRHSEHGRHGIVALRTALDAWAVDERPADSVLESAFLRLCGSHALPRPSFHERIEGWEVDFRFIGTPVIVECDGWATHGRSRHHFERDRRKDDDLRAAGWIPARFTYRAITNRGADTARRIRRLLDRWSTTPAPDSVPSPA